MSRFFLEIEEDGRRFPVGDPRGVATLDEAIVSAKRHVDDALPRNTVRVLKSVGHAYLAGDGDAEWSLGEP